MIIIDTNVLVSGLLTNDTNAPPARILDAVVSRTTPFVMSPALLNEYRQVLLRPRIARRHGLREQDIDELLTTLVQNAAWAEPPSNGEQAPDAGDNRLWALLAAMPEAILATGDQLLLDDPPTGKRLVSPSAYLRG